jgi:histone H3/H4
VVACAIENGVEMNETWKNCGSCKKPIRYAQKHWVCSVSTCQSARFSPVFCTVGCWDAHVPMMNHRSSAWAEEAFAPKEAPISTRLPSGGGDSDELRARMMRQMAADQKGAAAKDVLIVASKLKKYMKEKAGMSCSADVLEALSDVVRIAANDAIDRARDDGRKTVKARDFRTR